MAKRETNCKECECPNFTVNISSEGTCQKRAKSKVKSKIKPKPKAKSKVKSRVKAKVKSRVKRKGSTRKKSEESECLNCTSGKRCGHTCISKSRTCHKKSNR